GEERADAPDQDGLRHPDRDEGRLLGARPMQPGSWVTPNIRLVRVLDQGSMGSVWVADHTTLGTQVAVKFMSPEVSRNPQLVTRFSREAHAAAQIRSPHVVQTLDHGITPDG